MKVHIIQRYNWGEPSPGTQMTVHRKMLLYFPISEFGIKELDELGYKYAIISSIRVLDYYFESGEFCAHLISGGKFRDVTYPLRKTKIGRGHFLQSLRSYDNWDSLIGLYKTNNINGVKQRFLEYYRFYRLTDEIIEVEPGSKIWKNLYNKVKNKKFEGVNNFWEWCW